MTNYYMSTVARGDYALGDDSNNGLSKAAPWLSFNKLNGIPAGDHDLHVNSDLVTGNAASNNTDTRITFHDAGFGDDQPVVRTNSASYCLQLVTDPSSGFIFEDPFTFDCTNATQAAINIAAFASDGCTLTLPDGMKFINTAHMPRVIRVQASTGTLAHQITINAIDCTDSMGLAVIELLEISNSTVLIDGANFGVHPSLTGTSYYPVIANGSGASSSLTVRNCTGSLTSSGNNASLFGMRAENVVGVVFEDNTISLTATTGATRTVHGARVYGTTRGADAVVRRNTFTLNAVNGYGVLIGSNSVTSHLTHNALVQSNTIDCRSAATTNNIHGVMMGYCNNGNMGNNTISGALIGVIAKGADAVVAYGNSVDYIAEAGQGLRAKGADNIVFIANNITLRAGYEDISSVFEHNEDLGVAGLSGTGRYIGNNVNILAGTALTGEKLVSVGDGGTDTSDASFEENNYYFADAALPADMFSYQGTDYGTLALWNASAAAQNETSVVQSFGGTGGVKVRTA